MWTDHTDAASSALSVPVEAPWPAAAERSPMTEQTIFVSQRRKIIELTNQYSIFGQDGGQIGSVMEVGQSAARKALRLLSDFDQFMTHRLEVRDAHGRPLVLLTRPAKVFEPTLVVQRADGAEIGRLVQRNVFGKIRFGMEVGGAEIGSLNAENWRAWNFSIHRQQRNRGSPDHQDLGRSAHHAVHHRRHLPRADPLATARPVALVGGRLRADRRYRVEAGFPRVQLARVQLKGPVGPVVSGLPSVR